MNSKHLKVPSPKSVVTLPSDISILPYKEFKPADKNLICVYIVLVPLHVKLAHLKFLAHYSNYYMYGFKYPSLVRSYMYNH